jgi:hypothetical protein
MEEVKEEVKQEETVVEPKQTITNQKLTMSDDIGDLAGALAKAQGQIATVNKGKQGYGYKFMDFAALVDAVKKPLSDNGLSFIQGHMLVRGKVPAMLGETLLMHESGQWIKIEMEGIITPMKQLSAIQAQGVSSQYLRRYMLQAILGVAAEDDQDASLKAK